MRTDRIMPRRMHSVARVALLVLQCFVVLFVALHNWIPLGTLNNVKGVRVEFPTGKLLVTTLINFTPFAIGLAATAFYLGRIYPAGSFGGCGLPTDLHTTVRSRPGGCRISFARIQSELLATERCTLRHMPFCRSTTASGRTLCMCSLTL
jgi:hypothetical protein